MGATYLSNFTKNRYGKRSKAGEILLPGDMLHQDPDQNLVRSRVVSAPPTSPRRMNMAWKDVCLHVRSRTHEQLPAVGWQEKDPDPEMFDVFQPPGVPLIDLFKVIKLLGRGSIRIVSSMLTQEELLMVADEPQNARTPMLLEANEGKFCGNALGACGKKQKGFTPLTISPYFTLSIGLFVSEGRLLDEEEGIATICPDGKGGCFTIGTMSLGNIKVIEIERKGKGYSHPKHSFRPMIRL